MAHRAFLTAVFAFLLLGGGCGKQAVRPAKQETPQQVVQRFFVLCGQGRYEAATALWEPIRKREWPRYFKREILRNAKSLGDDWREGVRPRVLCVRRKGDKTTIAVDRGEPGKERHVEYYEVKRIRGRYKIWGMWEIGDDTL